MITGRAAPPAAPMQRAADPARSSVPPAVPPDLCQPAAKSSRIEDSVPPNQGTSSPPPKQHGVVPDFLYEAHFAEPPKKPMRFLSPDTPVASGAPRPTPPTPDVPITAPKPPPANIEPPRVSREALDKKPLAPPPTYFDPNAHTSADPKHPLKKLPWEK